MASSSSKDLFEPTQISSSISADEAPHIITVHGFFYQANTKIGAQVDNLYKEGCQRSANIEQFKPILQEDPRLGNIFEPYSAKSLRAIPWGETPKGDYYTWNPEVDSGLVFYMVGPGSRFEICDSSHNLKLGRQKRITDIGLCQTPGDLLQSHERIQVEMKEGGVLIVHPNLSHGTEGRSIAFGGLPAQAGMLKTGGHRS
ncbi:hypothetical protein QBC33DRAFT_211434 [Phialemonium atrogriseum]|uniref:Uncharacterized protein n=1 Tax=Phialemonium atrogriseum TaxID=1093897 RepID=A0AAJ0BV87_9PEZI|nr:uncharacterized protein QBC33DRAFT_211434 [Phialemonium atrogriseum]KAK1764013.1 hypothetical protein QBC33DRAFT_211434 [Phialemonium atrogriseum]